jgi:AraC-like DNA-binding protein
MIQSTYDRLDELLNLFPVHARMFHGGTLCGVTNFVPESERGQLHLVRSGAVTVVHQHHVDVRVTEPSVLLYPRPIARRFVSDVSRGVDLVCANLHFEGGPTNPIMSALPEVVCLPLSGVTGANHVLDLLFEEALASNTGRHALVDRLFDVFLVQLLRNLMETDQIHAGLVAGMSNPKLRKALLAVHERPDREWSLDTLAHVAGVSRSIFANSFRNTVGCTPGVYLQAWRIRLTQRALKKGQQLKMIAVEVGYGSEAALSRAFKAQCGFSPREWLAAEAGI